MDLGLAGAAVLVIGGTKGMGRAAAEAMAAEGARVAVLARSIAGLEDTVNHLHRLGAPEARALCADITEGEQVAEALAQLGLRWGELNVLVNATGPVGIGVGRFTDIDDDEWAGTFDVGVLGTVRCVRAALPLLRAAAWARIVNVSAHSTRRQSPDLVAYTAAKSALTSLSKNLALSMAPEGILVNTVSPGSFLSDGLRDYLAALPAERAVDPGDLRDAMRVIEEDFGHPAWLGRAGAPEEIGPLIAFLGSRRNTYMTGTNVNVDGGSDF
ncbi:MAG TPA: SDR family oxidoreductase [Pseudonocardiaceae bacterium]|jgi:NAD(P)-dependent dehydrogenase (short-subunit alcohol dehydrogenase family)